MALNYIHLLVTDIIVRQGQRREVCFSVAVVAGYIQLGALFSDCHNFTSRSIQWISL